MPHHPPVVLCLSGHDPTGGAGIQADIETLRALHCHPATVITALTAQDTHDVKRVYPQSPEHFLTQARLLMADLPVAVIAVIKVGLLGSAEIAEAVIELIDELGTPPVVVDPILAAGGGHVLATDRLSEVMVKQLLPRSTIITPNTPEARRLTGQQDYDACASALRAMGCAHVVLTGAHEEGQEVINRWYSDRGRIDHCWPRLPGNYHGSGCTLAAALAAGLAQGLSMVEANAAAQRFTWESLRDGYALGQGQRLPHR